MTHFARALGASRTGVARRRAAFDSRLCRLIQERLTQAKEGFWAEQVAIQHMGATAFLAMAEEKSGRRAHRDARRRGTCST